MISTINIAGRYMPRMSDRLLNSLAHFRTKAEAVKFARTIAWQVNDCLRVHGNLWGYRWIVADPHLNAVAARDAIEHMKALGCDTAWYLPEIAYAPESADIAPSR